jgi:hypothetical protein
VGRKKRDAKRTKERRRKRGAYKLDTITKKGEEFKGGKEKKRG